jgi:hypothetical protein
LSLTACITPRGEYGPDATGPEGRVTLEVSNHGHCDVRVYLDRDGVLFPLGRVNRMRTARFPLSEGMLTHALQYALVTRPVTDGDGFRTDPVVVFPGWLHRWTLFPTSGLFHGVEGRAP